MTDTEKKKGKAITYIATTKGVFSTAEIFFKSAKEDLSSSQLKEIEDYTSFNGLISPPYSPDMFLTLYESNAVLSACINQTARDVTGVGWSIQLKSGKQENKEEKTKLESFFDDINPEKPFRALLGELLVDLNAVGYFGIEVIRDSNGNISKLYRIPAHTLKVHRSKTTFCQIRSEKRVWFKLIGNKLNISKTTGKEAIEATDYANEIIYHRRPYPKSDYYGVPPSLPAVGDIVGLISSRDYNINFFQNYGIPTAIITLTGEWDETAEVEIKKFLTTEMKGVENAHRTLVVSQTEDCKITIDPIDMQVKEGGFKDYESTCKENILIAFSMPPERIGLRVVGELGGNVAEEATKVYLDGVIKPMQEDIEDIINRYILQMGLGIEAYVFKFKEIDSRNLDSLIGRLSKEIQTAIINPNTARQELGLPSYEGGDTYYQMGNLLEVGAPKDEARDRYNELFGPGQNENNKNTKTEQDSQ